MPTWQQLRDVKLSEFTDAADGWGKVSSRSNADKDRVDNQMLRKVRDTQKGMTADKAVWDMDQLSRNYQYLHAECGLIRTALNGLATELAGPQRRLKQALEDAESLKFTVNPDGSVEYPAGGENLIEKKPLPGGTASDAPLGVLPPANTWQGPPLLTPPGTPPGLTGGNPNQARAQAIAYAIGAAVREALEIDGRYSRTLAQLKAAPGLAVEAETFADVAADTKRLQDAAGRYLFAVEIPNGKNSEENAAWWKGLTQEQRDEYATLYPASIGSLDGLPSTVRDDANRMVLAETKAKFEMQLAAYPPEPRKMVPFGPHGDLVVSNTWQKWHDGKAALEGRKKGMDAIEERLNRNASSGLPEAYLLRFDGEKDDGRVVLANGNPDTADHTSVYVPGTKTKLPDIDKDLTRSERLWDRSHRLNPGADISTITWFDYNAPNNIPAAYFNQFYEGGATTLREFMNGVETAQGGPDKSHTTLIGHSYGSTLIGCATQQGQSAGPIADDIIAAGSPGMTVRHATELGLDRKNVWALSGGSDDNFVRWGGALSGHGEGWTIPTSERFGANIMESDARDHGGYWNERSTALDNQAAVIAGLPEKVKLE
ncbi:alpha/beta hydrolase [Streptomyces sp. NPDC051907]|uniref:alpha/beta hydrolase n=1 Tax=Streptomyces sp. NPDC051907 TaxID=3155284 RepID=UPI003421BEB5